MEWYFYLHYFIYRFYKRKKDNMPGMYSILATVVLLHFNIFAIWAAIQTFTSLITKVWVINLIPHYKIWIIGEMAILALLNYLILYRKKKYIEVFDDFARNSDNYKKWDKSVKWYIILSIVFMLVTLYGSVLLRDYYVGDVRWI